MSAVCFIQTYVTWVIELLSFDVWVARFGWSQVAADCSGGSGCSGRSRAGGRASRNAGAAGIHVPERVRAVAPDDR